LYARQRCSKNYPGIASAREENDELVRDESDNDEEEDEDVGHDNVDEEDDDSVAIINHKDSMRILAEKYNASRKDHARKCGKLQNKAQALEVIDQSRQSPRESPRESSRESPRESPRESRRESRRESPYESPRDESASVKHVYHFAHCESCGNARALGRDRGHRHAPPEGEHDRLKCPLNGIRSCCSSRAPCARIF